METQGCYQVNVFGRRVEINDVDHPKCRRRGTVASHLVHREDDFYFLFVWLDVDEAWRDGEWRSGEKELVRVGLGCLAFLP